MKRRASLPRVVGVGTVAVALVVVIGIAVGSATVSPGDALGVLANRLFGTEIDVAGGADAIVWNIRLPRVLLALFGGAILGVTGSVLQGSLKNPLADSQLVGLSAVASIGALVGYGVGYASSGTLAGVVGGMLAGLGGAWFVWLLAARTGGEPSRFILVGIGTGLGLGALVAAASIAVHDPRVPDVAFWFFGGLGAATWDTAWQVGVIAAFVVGGVIPFVGRLDIMSIGHASARHAGVSVATVLTTTLGLCGLGVGATVGAFGVVGFVGLVGGRFAVAMVGPHHRVAIPAAAFSGALFLAASDIIGRVGGRGFEVPVGLVTTVLGGAYLVWLIVTRRLAV